MEHRGEYYGSFLGANVHFKKAFHSIDWGSLWDLLRKLEIPAWILSLISALYINTESWGDVSRLFPVQSRVR